MQKLGLQVNRSQRIELRRDGRTLINKTIRRTEDAWRSVENWERERASIASDSAKNRPSVIGSEDKDLYLPPGPSSATECGLLGRAAPSPHVRLSRRISTGPYPPRAQRHYTPPLLLYHFSRLTFAPRRPRTDVPRRTQAVYRMWRKADSPEGFHWLQEQLIERSTIRRYDSLGGVISTFYRARVIQPATDIKDCARNNWIWQARGVK